ncbi:glycoside hydrolase family 16 protein [Exidia glandulosa HHB12029]|uniref:Glycoside hydrolase family 16 protein n=1 Tax=Exidia glandulosa HHB12029 TaxID=1314781 RepID=A0A165CUK7_EXIGL|nr:glycoside hydrolase family 16 protein [Exidia glandulosa HHB12029]
MLLRPGAGACSCALPLALGLLDRLFDFDKGVARLCLHQGRYAISPDPSFWKEYQDYDLEDPDDFLHNPDPKNYSRGHIFTRRGFVNLGCLFILFMGILGVFAIYPITTFVLKDDLSDFGAFNIGGINASGQVSTFLGRGLIDPDTPQAEHTITSFNTGEEWDLVFSDEFNVEGRSFYPGDDPYWEAVDLHYYQTSNLEWYDPQQVVTTNGAMRIWFNQTKNHDLNFMGGMVSTWNKFCFTGGMVLASVSLPGSPKLSGLWPAVWTMGNLGRAGYGASLEGMWPYQGYDECDKGTLANQTLPGDTVIPTNGDPQNQGLLSFLPGQRLSRCTCMDDTSHPGPRHDDGTFVGRSAPEIDILEATIGPSGGVVSQSAQFGPFDDGYQWDESKATIANASNTIVNGYHGGVFQEAVSALSMTNQNAYTQLDGPTVFATYGYEYKPGYEGSYISWINNGVLSWTMDGDAVAANEAAGISRRAVSQEPMYIIANLGMSPTFGRIDPNLLLPVHMDIDWIRVYQPRGAYNVGCDPPEMPTLQYINDHFEAYNNPNLTVFSESPGAPSFPGNRLLGQCPNEA